MQAMTASPRLRPTSRRQRGEGRAAAASPPCSAPISWRSSAGSSQPPSALPQRDRLAGARARVLAPPRPARLEVEAQVDVELFFQRQHDDRAAGVALDAGDHLVAAALREAAVTTNHRL
jgi:hypothetical protein